MKEICEDYEESYTSNIPFMFEVVWKEAQKEAIKLIEGSKYPPQEITLSREDWNKEIDFLIEKIKGSDNETMENRK